MDLQVVTLVLEAFSWVWSRKFMIQDSFRVLGVGVWGGGWSVRSVGLAEYSQVDNLDLWNIFVKRD